MPYVLQNATCLCNQYRHDYAFWPYNESIDNCSANRHVHGTGSWIVIQPSRRVPDAAARTYCSRALVELLLSIGRSSITRARTGFISSQRRDDAASRVRVPAECCQRLRGHYLVLQDGEIVTVGHKTTHFKRDRHWGAMELKTVTGSGGNAPDQGIYCLPPAGGWGADRSACQRHVSPKGETSPLAVVTALAIHVITTSATDYTSQPILYLGA